MFITKKEFGDYIKAVFKWTDAGKVSVQRCDEFLAWGHDALDGFADDANVKVPVEFQGLLREFRKSYKQDADAVLLELEQKAHPAPYEPLGDHTYDKKFMREKILKQFEQLTDGSKSAMDGIECARRGRSELGLSRALREVGLQRQASHSELIREAVMCDPFQRAFWSGFAKALGGASTYLSLEEKEALNLGLLDSDGKEIMRKSLTAGTSPGSLWLSEAVARAVFDICRLYGAYKTLRVIQLLQGKTKFVKVTALPTAIWLIPSALQGATIPADTSLSGAATSQECNTLAISIEASLELLADEKVDWGVALLEKIARGLAAALDYASFAADGTADRFNGGQTGIFRQADVAVANAATGHDNVYALTHSDFLLAPGAVSPVALQQGGRWWVHPSFLPQLLLLKDGNVFLCQTPAQNPSGEYTLCGFPMSLTAAAPSAGTARDPIGPGSPIGAFGWGDAYTIGMREDAEIMTGEPKWNQCLKNIRALTRARCDMGDASMFAILKLGPSS